MAAPLTAERHHYPVLENLPEPLRQDLIRGSSRFQVPEGTTLFDLGMRCAGFVLVLDGEVEVTRPAANGREMLLYRLTPGDTCVMTLTALLGEGSYGARAVTRTRASGRIISPEVFQRLLDAVPEFRNQVFDLLATRLDRVVAALEATAFSPVEQRLAAELLQHENDVVSVTHQRLADAVGCVREVASRHLSAWAKAGWIASGRGNIRILDRSALEHILAPLGHES